MIAPSATRRKLCVARDSARKRLKRRLLRSRRR